jgi:hypothetical protein
MTAMNPSVPPWPPGQRPVLWQVIGVASTALPEHQTGVWVRITDCLRDRELLCIDGRYRGPGLRPGPCKPNVRFQPEAWIQAGVISRDGRNLGGLNSEKPQAPLTLRLGVGCHPTGHGCAGHLHAGASQGDERGCARSWPKKNRGPSWFSRIMVSADITDYNKTN